MAENELKVGVDIFPPFVIGDGRSFRGFEIDLWEKIAKEINLPFSYTRVKFQELILALKDKKIGRFSRCMSPESTRDSTRGGLARNIER